MGLFRSNILVELHFGYSNSTFRTNFDTGLTTKTFVSFYWISFAVYLFWGELIALLWLIFMGVNAENWDRQVDIDPAHV